MTNKQIYESVKKLNKAFQECSQYLPIKVNFYLQKNKTTLTNLAQEIEKSRIEILQHYGTIDEETGNYQFDQQAIQDANKELNDLFLIEQEVEIYKVNIEDFGNDVLLTPDQMEALMFMIND